MKNQAQMKEWFESWFDTPYYHILYKNRDYSEAKLFIRNLFDVLDLDGDAKVLDLACGKGRHSIFVNSLGYDTTGVDLSASSIETARKSENEQLHFFQHDMRAPIVNHKFDLVLNLFTSFGYFEQKGDNERVVSSVANCLNRNGKLVIDFMNVSRVVADLVPFEEKEVDGILFRISKEVKDGFIVKDISFEVDGKIFNYQEKVQTLDLNDFKSFLSAANFDLEAVYGNYQLQKFEENSERLIIITKKSN